MVSAGSAGCTSLPFTGSLLAALGQSTTGQKSKLKCNNTSHKASKVCRSDELKNRGGDMNADGNWTLYTKFPSNFPETYSPCQPSHKSRRNSSRG